MSAKRAFEYPAKHSFLSQANSPEKTLSKLEVTPASNNVAVLA